MKSLLLVLFGALMMMGCAVEGDSEAEEMGETSSSISSSGSTRSSGSTADSSDDVDAWLASQGARGDELEALLDEGEAARTAGFIGKIGKAISKVIVRFNLGSISKAVIGQLRVRLDHDVFVSLDFEPAPGSSKPNVENAVRIVQIQAALRDGAPLDPVTDKTGTKLAARFGGKPSQYRVYEGSDFKGTDGSTISTRVFVRPGKTSKVVAARTVTTPASKSSKPITVDLPKDVF